MNIFKPLFTVQCSVALLLVSLGGCQPDSEFGEEFIRMSIPEQRRLILEYPLEQQVELYLKTMREKHPPDLGLSSVVASHGEDLVPILRAKLVTEDQDIRKMELVGVFYDMQVLGYYSVATDRELMYFLEQQVAVMEDPLWKELAVRKLTLIKEESKRRPGAPPR